MGLFHTKSTNFFGLKFLMFKHNHKPLKHINPLTLEEHINPLNTHSPLNFGRKTYTLTQNYYILLLSNEYLALLYKDKLSINHRSNDSFKFPKKEEKIQIQVSATVIKLKYL